MFSIKDYHIKRERIDELTVEELKVAKMDLSILLSLVELAITRK